MSVKAYINLTTPTDRFRLRLSGGGATLDNLAQVLALRPANNALRLDPLPALPPTLAGNPLTGAGTTAGGGPGGGAFRAELSYYLYDHLGHTRMVFHTTLGGPASPSYGPEFLADYYPYGRILRQWNPCQQERYLTTHHERDAETGYDYRGARYYDADLGRFLAVDPLAGEYSSISPYTYVANDPLKYIDPDGRKIVNPYENYSQYSGLEQRLRNNIANASTRSESRIAKKELRANSANIQGYNNYQEVQGLLLDFKQVNESEYNRVDNLHLNGVEIDVVVGLNDNYKGDEGQLGETSIRYDPSKIISVNEFQTGESYLLPTKITNNKIGITLYSGGRTLGTLANEFGDAIFGVENPRASLDGLINNTSYWDKPSTRFSFDYENFIIKGGSKPNPEEY